MKSHAESKNLSLLQFVVTVLAIWLTCRYFIAQPFLVSGTSMYPNFDSWHYLIVDEFTYIFIHEPRRGDVVVIKYPLNPSQYFIKRIIGLPGDTVRIHGSSVTIVNNEYPEGITLKEPYVAQGNESVNELEVTLKSGDYFVMGDNRIASSDSRYWGSLPRANIVGRAFVRLFPFTKITLFPASLDKFAGGNY